MSCDDLARLDFEVAEEAKDPLWFIAGVDDQCCRVGLQDIAVGLQASDHKRVYLGQWGSLAMRFRENMNLERSLEEAAPK